MSNYRPISISSTFSKIYEFVIHGHVSNNLCPKFNLCERGFTKTKPTATHLAYISRPYYSSGLFSATGWCHLFLLQQRVWPSSARTAMPTLSNCRLSEQFGSEVTWPREYLMSLTVECFLRHLCATRISYRSTASQYFYYWLGSGAVRQCWRQWADIATRYRLDGPGIEFR
jgi:hypothetical protein